MATYYPIGMEMNIRFVQIKKLTQRYNHKRYSVIVYRHQNFINNLMTYLKIENVTERLFKVYKKNIFNFNLSSVCR